MIEFIQSETKRIMYDCMLRHAKKQNIDISDVQLVLGLDVEGNTYTVCENYEPKVHMDFMGVLGVRIDFKGYSMIAPPFIEKSIKRFAKQYGIKNGDTKVMCVPTKNEKGKPDVLLYLYNGGSYVETITFSQLFREEDIEMPKV